MYTVCEIVHLYFYSGSLNGCDTVLTF